MKSKIQRKYNKFLLGLSLQQNLFWGFLVYMVAGWLLLSLPFLHKQSASLLDHLFIATSALSTTGLVTISVSDTYTGVGQFIVMLLFQIGGIGYMTFISYIMLSTAKKITHWHQRLLKTEFTLPQDMQLKDFLRSVIVFTAIMESIGVILFFIAFKQEGMANSEALWNSVFHSISAFCTAGFSLFNTGFEAYTGNTFINLTISILAIAGSLGFIVVTDLWLRLKSKKNKLSFTTKIIFYGFILLLSFGFVFLFFFEPSLRGLDLADRAKAAFFQSMTSMTTVGFNTVPIGGLSHAILLVIIFLMYIGASPSGTAGGMKITTFTAIFAIIKSRLRGENRVTFLGRTIPLERLYIATSVFIFYTTLIFFGSFLMTFTEHYEFEMVLFEVASALGTVGLSTGITGDLTSYGKIVIICLMFIGRLGVLTFGLALLAKKKKGADRPKERMDIAV